MHGSSYQRMAAFACQVRERFSGRPIRLLDVGSMNVNGDYRGLFAWEKVEYVGLDVAPGPGVDLVPQDPYQWSELPDNTFDVIISGQALEHVEYPWLVLEQIARKLKPEGLVCLIAPSRGPQHRYPVDCYRYLPDGMAALARWAGLEVLEIGCVQEDEKYPDGSELWGDCSCVLTKRAPAACPRQPPAPSAPSLQTPLLRELVEMFLACVPALDAVYDVSADGLGVPQAMTGSRPLRRVPLLAEHGRSAWWRRLAGVSAKLQGRRDGKSLATCGPRYLKLATGSAVWAVGLGVLEETADLRQVVAEIGRVLDPHATVLLTALPPHPNNGAPRWQPLSVEKVSSLLEGFAWSRVFAAGGLVAALAGKHKSTPMAEKLVRSLEIWQRVWRDNAGDPAPRILTPPVPSRGRWFQLDLGCGRYCRAEFIGLDAKSLPGVGIRYDLSRGIPFPDGSVDQIYTAHFLEHLADPCRMLEEIYRVCIDGALVEIIVPLNEPSPPSSAELFDVHHTLFDESWFDRHLAPERFEVLDRQVEQRSGTNPEGRVHSWTQMTLRLKVQK